MTDKYKGWSRSDFIRRIHELEEALIRVDLERNALEGDLADAKRNIIHYDAQQRIAHRKEQSHVGT